MANEKITPEIKPPVKAEAAPVQSGAQYYKIWPTKARTYFDPELNMNFTQESPYITNDPAILAGCKKNGYLTMQKTDIDRAKKKGK